MGRNMPTMTKKEFLERYKLSEEDLRAMREYGLAPVTPAEGLVAYHEDKVLLHLLIKKSNDALRFIGECLRPRKDVDQQLLGEYEKVFGKFIAGKPLDRVYDVDILDELQKIANRPSGANYDFTEATSLEFDGEYRNLGDFVEEIGDLVSRYRLIEKE